MVAQALPNQIPPQSATWGKVDKDGNLTVDMNVWLFLYNLAGQVLAPAPAQAVVTAGDLIAISETDNEMADVSVLARTISNLAGLESVDVELIGAQLPNLVASITNAILLNLEPPTISAADVAPFVPTSTSPLSPALGGTGINNGAKTITLGASLTTTGAGAPTFAFSGSPFTYTFSAASGTVVTSSAGAVTGLTSVGTNAVASTASALTLTAPVGQNLILQSNGSTTAFLDTGNNLLMGVSTLAVQNANAVMLNPSGGLVYVLHLNGTASGSTYVGFGYNGAGIGSITQSGTTAVLYNTTSDPRLKEIDGPVTNSGEFIDALRPVIGSWKADGSPFTGFLADEYQRVDPSAVVGMPGAVDEAGEPIFQQMEYGSSAWCANVTAELQSLRKRLEAANIQ